MIDIVLLFWLTDLKAQIAWVDGVSGFDSLTIYLTSIKLVHSGRRRGLSSSFNVLNMLDSPQSLEVLLRLFMNLRSERSSLVHCTDIRERLSASACCCEFTFV